MRRIYHKWHSPTLSREMELLEFGHAGLPIIVFPTSRGRFYEYEDRNMIATLAPKIDRGELHVFCVDSVDAESFYAYHKHPGARIWRHVQYDRYLTNELVPLIRHINPSTQLCVTGCSFGGYHSVNYAFKHPGIVTHCVSMGGAYDMHSFFGKWSNKELYFNQPLDYLPNLNDGWYWNNYQKMWTVLATGEQDICLGDNLRLAHVLGQKSIPHYLDVWGNGTGHDWHWWQAMARKYFQV